MNGKKFFVKIIKFLVFLPFFAIILRAIEKFNSKISFLGKEKEQSWVAEGCLAFEKVLTKNTYKPNYGFLFGYFRDSC